MENDDAPDAPPSGGAWKLLVYVLAIPLLLILLAEWLLRS
jgi:hypothetical protein